MKSITRDPGWLGIAPAVAHEIGHLRGLVDTMLSGADGHNSKPLIRGEVYVYTHLFYKLEDGAFITCAVVNSIMRAIDACQ